MGLANSSGPRERSKDVTFEIYLGAVSWGAFAMVITAAVVALCVVAVYYIYKAAESAIRKQPQAVSRMKKSPMFRRGDKPAISMVKQEREKLAKKIAVK